MFTLHQFSSVKTPGGAISSNWGRLQNSWIGEPSFWSSSHVSLTHRRCRNTFWPWFISSEIKNGWYNWSNKTEDLRCLSYHPIIFHWSNKLSTTLYNWDKFFERFSGHGIQHLRHLAGPPRYICHDVGQNWHEERGDAERYKGCLEGAVAPAKSYICIILCIYIYMHTYIIHLHVRIDGWMDGCMNGWMDEWMLDGWTDGCVTYYDTKSYLHVCPMVPWDCHHPWWMNFRILSPRVNDGQVSFKGSL